MGGYTDERERHYGEQEGPIYIYIINILFNKVINIYETIKKIASLTTASFHLQNSIKKEFPSLPLVAIRAPPSGNSGILVYWRLQV